MVGDGVAHWFELAWLIDCRCRDSGVEVYKAHRIMLHGEEMSWLIGGVGCMAHRIKDDVAHMAIQKLIFLDKEGRWIQDKVSLR